MGSGSRAERRQREREKQRATQVTKGALGPSSVELTVNTSLLPEPDKVFYANAATTVRRPQVLSAIFGQFSPGRADIIHTCVAIDIPAASVAMIVDSSTVSPFREILEANRGRQPITPYPAGQAPQNSITYAAHLVKLVVNEFEAVLDFFELTPRLGRAPEVSPVIRIKAFPPVLAFFVDECGRFLAEQAP